MFQISDAQESLAQEMEEVHGWRSVVRLVAPECELDSWIPSAGERLQYEKRRPVAAVRDLQARLDCLVRWRTQDTVVADRNHTAWPPSWIKITAGWRGFS